MRVNFIASSVSRKVYPEDKNGIVAVRQDHKSDIVRILFKPEEFEDVGIDISTAVIKILYIEPEGETKVATTTGTMLPNGYFAADWEITGDITDQANSVNFVVVVKVIENEEVKAAWFSVTSSFKIFDTLDDADGPYEDDITQDASAVEMLLSLRSALTALEARVAALEGGA